MNNFSEIVMYTLKKYNNVLKDDELNKFSKYANLLVEWNKKINLTAITDPENIAIKHFLDSISVFEVLKVPKDARVIDVGSGAGFPGVPMKIVKQDIKITLLDSLNKRLLFLDELLYSLNLNGTIIHSRAEELSRKPAHREKYDIAISRAVASLNVLSEYCMPFVKVGGAFVAMKGSRISDELKDAKNAIDVLGGEVDSVNKFYLPDGSERNIIIIKKLKETSTIYPRHGSKISKKAL